jgi:serine/threonine protein kinase
MGDVWLAEDPTGAAGGAPRRVALKLLEPALAAEPDARARFSREVAAARRVSGRCVASILDADLEAQPPWLASEYVAGPTLAEHVAQHGGLAEGPLRSLGAALADALVAIHASGVVHRDLNPRNVVLGPEGPRVVDFGIAVYPGATSITQSGSVMGTPAWMAPEQLTDDASTPATDVWSWGAVMAYAARGRPPVAASRPEVALHRMAQGEYDLEDLPAWLDPWVRSAMAGDPTTRPTADELLAWITGRSAPTDATVPEMLDHRWVSPTVVEPVPDEATWVLDRAIDAEIEQRGSRQMARWGSALVIMAAALALGLTADLLVVVVGVAVLAVVTVGMVIFRERRPDGAPPPIPPTWAFGLAVPVLLGAGLSTVIGVAGAVIALLVLLIGFFALGGDLG